MKVALLPFLLFVTVGCQSLEPFQDTGPYRFEKDPLASFYSDIFYPIRGKSFDSDQVSNKHLDSRMVKALDHLNQLLSNPSELPKKVREPLIRGKLNVITIASASRSPLHQASLGKRYRAKAFHSNHLLGLAVDLEMNGKPFDIKRRGKEQEVKEVYEALKQVMAMAGLFFSEPPQVDPNHVELLEWSRKSDHPSFDFEEWKKSSLFFYEKLENRMKKLMESHPRGLEKRLLERQMIDLGKRIDEILASQDAKLLRGG